MCGNATLAMLVSRTSINAAIATTTAISQGLCFGRQGSAGGAAGESVSLLVDIHFRINRHAGPQPAVVVLVRIDIDADRNALHYLHVVPGSVLRG